MSLLALRDLSISFGGPMVLDGINLVVKRGERIAVVGRNGAGKSTLFKIIRGELKPDSGVADIADAKLAALDQEVPQATHGTVFDVVASGLAHVGQVVSDYHHAIEKNDLAKMADLQQEIDALDGWHVEQRVNQVITRLELNAAADFDALSGGMKRRVLLGRALVVEPDVLLLDEPTNHLDITSIEWLEKFLIDYQATVIFVTHDRRFLQAIATRIIELDRGVLSDFPGDYQRYLNRKEEMLEVETRHNALFDKKLAQEEVWIRQGIKARRTRNEGRVRALEALRVERSKRRDKLKNPQMLLQEAERSGRLVIKAKNICYEVGDKKIVDHFTTVITRGEKIALIGANGCGKSTLLKLLLKQLEPSAGTVNHGTGLEIAYFDQLRTQIDESQTLVENVGQGSDSVIVNGKPKHIIGYLQDFLFTPDRARGPISRLSGGERNRLLLAKLFTKPANVLVLDEPTNDLDIETLELLEELLVDYQGTLLLVSHDREFVNHIATSTLVFSEKNKIEEYVGGYDDYLRQRPTTNEIKPATVTTPVTVVKKSASSKLPYHLQRELQELPKKIDELEKKISAIQAIMAEPDFYQSGEEKIAASATELKSLEDRLQQAFVRWEELESRAQS